MARAKTSGGKQGVAGVREDAGRVKSKLTIGSRLSSSPSSLAAAESVCTGAIVTYDIIGQQTAADPLGLNAKKLPRPGPIVASIGFYSILGLAAAASESFAPVIVAVGWVLALAVLVTGKRGQGIVKLLNGFATLAARTGQGNTGVGNA